MDSTPASASEREQRFQEVVTAYLDDLEAGRAEDLQVLLGRHPDLAEDIARFLADQEQIHRLAAPLRDLPGGRDAGEAANLAGGTLGDFRIVREIGRGGMGVVYEAEQMSLNRRVALKVLPLAGLFDPRHLQRFRNEAQTAACLHHPNVVPVFAVGSERGVHYYAMQLIEGQTLAAVIQELGQGRQEEPPSPEAPTPLAAAASTVPLPALTAGSSTRSPAFFRTVAELGVQAAEALDYAHQMGVVHRDVKPSNLLLDGRGNLWVTDFGLAQVQSDTRLTLTGDLVGTLRYMSPEQALAKRGVIDHRSDVYSLGATLYELLTLEPAFAGQDRQELLRQIAFEEPQPPRRLNKAIPQELETIVLKALEKNPAERYGTAQELADDLRRFLEDRPIQARRPTWRQLAIRWARRHKSAVWAGAVVFLLAAVLVGGAWGWRTLEGMAADAQARRLLQDLDRLQAEGRLPQAVSAIEAGQTLAAGSMVNPSLRQRLRERQADLDLADRLQEIRLKPSDSIDATLAIDQQATAYEEAFREFGIDVLRLPSTDAAQRLQATSVRVELAAALDDWAIMGLAWRPKESPKWKALLALARVADSDERRNRLRDALEPPGPRGPCRPGQVGNSYPDAGDQPALAWIGPLVRGRRRRSCRTSPQSAGTASERFLAHLDPGILPHQNDAP